MMKQGVCAIWSTLFHYAYLVIIIVHQISNSLLLYTLPLSMIQESYCDGTLPLTKEQLRALCWVRFHVRCHGDAVLIYQYNTCWCALPTTLPTSPPTSKPPTTTPSPTTPACPRRSTYNEVTGLCDCDFGRVYDWVRKRCVCPRGHRQRYNRSRRVWECVCPVGYHRQLGWNYYKCCLPGQVLDEGGNCVCAKKECPSGYVSHDIYLDKVPKEKFIQNIHI